MTLRNSLAKGMKLRDMDPVDYVVYQKQSQYVHLSIRFSVIISVAAPKISSNFRESFAKISALKIESFQNFATIFKILA